MIKGRQRILTEIAGFQNGLADLQIPYHDSDAHDDVRRKAAGLFREAFGLLYQHAMSVPDKYFEQ